MSPFELEFRKILLANEYMSQAIANIINSPRYSATADSQLLDSLDREVLDLMSARSLYSQQSAMSMRTDVSGISTGDDIRLGYSHLTARSKIDTADEMSIEEAVHIHDDSSVVDSVDNHIELSCPDDSVGVASRSGLSAKSDRSVRSVTSLKSSVSFKSKKSENSTISAKSNKSVESDKETIVETSRKPLISARSRITSKSMERSKSTLSTEQIGTGEN